MTADNMELIKQEAELSDVTSQTELPAEAASAGDNVDATDEEQQRPTSAAGSLSPSADLKQDEEQSSESPTHSHSQDLQSPLSEGSSLSHTCKAEVVDNDDETDVQSDSEPASRTSSAAGDTKVETSTWVSAGDRESQSPICGAGGPNGTSFLQKLESFVASLDDKTKAGQQTDGNNWRQMHAAIRGIRMPHAGTANNQQTTAGVGLTSAGARFNTVSAWNMLAQYTNKTLTPTDAPLDLSVKRRSPDSVAESGLRQRAFPIHPRISPHHRELSYLSGGGYATTTSNGNSLACLERDFGENSAILTRLGHGEVSQQPAPTQNVCNPSAGFLHQPLLQPQQLQRSFEPVISDSAPRTTNNRIGSGRKRTTAPRKATNLSTSANLKSHHQLPATPAAATTVRCLQCSRMFPSLPELTIHMIQAAHYANIIGCALPASTDADFDIQSVDSSGRATPLSHPGYSPSLPIKGARHSAGTGTLPLPYSTMGDGQGSRKIWRPDFGSVSPARSLDDESVSSTGLTEPESLSPSSSASPVSTTRLMEDSKGVDHVGLVSQLLQIQPLLAGGYFDVRGGLPLLLPIRAGGGGVANRERNMGDVRPPKDADCLVTKLLDGTAGSEVAVDLRRRHHAKICPVDTFYTNGIADPTAAMPTIHLAKLLDDIWSRRKKNGVAMKRLAVTAKCNSTKDHTAAAVPEKRAFISSSGGKRASHDGSRHGKANNSAIDSRIQPADSKCCDDTNHSSSSVHSLLYCGSSVENGGFAERQTAGRVPANRSPVSVPVSSYIEAIVSDRMRNGQMQVMTSTADVALDYDHHGNANNPAEGDSRGRNETPVLRKTVEETEYSARFGKYCRLARELAGKSE